MESVEIWSENVRPSSPTPLNLRTYKFSMLDQFTPSMMIPLVLFFPNSTCIDFSLACGMLKQSLSLILTRFYPLAGRVNSDRQFIDCNDEGVPFSVSMFRGHTLSDILRNPDYTTLHRLLPCGADAVVQLQLNCFDCGGISVGAVFTHKVADAVTVSAFLNSWAAATRGGYYNEPLCPNYILQSMFPHKEGVSEFCPPEYIMKTGRSVLRRYVFDSSAISSLKSQSALQCPTRVEVVTALIWKCFMAASLANDVAASTVSQAVNLRRRAKPPFPSDCLGNMVGSAVATSSNTNRRTLNELVKKLREATGEIGDGFIERMRGDEGLMGLQENIELGLRHIKQDVSLLSFTSWAGLGFYNADFGWGMPIWVAKCHVGRRWNEAFFNEVSLMDTRNGDGIEAWINLEERYMSVFDGCEELRAFTNSDPSPLDIS